MKYVAHLAGEEIDCEVDLDGWPAVRAVIGGRSYRIDVAGFGPDAFWFTVDGRSVEVAVTRSAGGTAVRVGDESFEVTVMDRRSRLDRARGGGAPRHQEIRAPMPGRVVAVLVRPGERIDAGQGVVVLEAMKMQNEIRAMDPGTIRQVNVGEGVSVNAGAVLVTID